MPRRRPAARRGRGRPRRARARRRPRRSRSARRPSRRPRPACRVERAVERLGREAVGDPQLRVDLRRHERRPQPGQDQRVDRARVARCAGPRPPRRTCASARPADEVALRGAVDQEPAAPRPPRLGGEALRLARTASARAPMSMPQRQRGDVERERRLADGLDQLRVGARAALVAGDVQPRRAARGVARSASRYGRRAARGRRGPEGGRYRLPMGHRRGLRRVVGSSAGVRAGAEIKQIKDAGDAHASRHVRAPRTLRCAERASSARAARGISRARACRTASSGFWAIATP